MNLVSQTNRVNLLLHYNRLKFFINKIKVFEFQKEEKENEAKRIKNSCNSVILLSNIVKAKNDQIAFQQ